MALISHWTLDNTAVSTTAVNDGTASNITYSGTDKVIGYNSAYFNGKSSAGGSNAYISVDSLNINAYTNYSFSMWVKSNNEYTDPEPLFLFGRSNSDYYRTTLQKPNAGNTILFSCIVAGSWQTVTGTKVAFDGTWHHVVCVTAGNPSANTKIYVDGVFDSELNYTRDSTATDRGTFGALRWNANNPYADQLLKGYLDDIRFYSHALTTTEITALYNDRYKPKWQTPLARWELDNNITDMYGLYNGTAVGTIAYTATSKSKGIAYTNAGGENWADLGNWKTEAYTNYTITGWAKVVATSTNKCFLFCQNSAGSTSAYKQFWVNTTGEVILQLSDNSTTYISATSTETTFSDSQWHHLVYVDANGTYIVYIDGRPCSISGNYTRFAMNTDKASIGASSASGAAANRLTVGSIDDVRFYDAALTADEVLSLYKSYAIPIWQQPLYHWKLDGNALDSAGTMNGTPVNMTYSAASKVTGSYGGVFSNTKYVIIDSLNPYAYTNYSFSFWCYAIDSGTGPGLVCFGQAASTEHTITIGLTSGTLYYYITGGTPSPSSYISTINTYGKWFFGTVTDANGTASVYLNGVYLGGFSYTRAAQAMDKGTIGARRIYTNNPQAGYELYGSMDDIRFYDTALTAAEVKSLYQSYFTEKAAGLMEFMGV